MARVNGAKRPRKTSRKTSGAGPDRSVNGGRLRTGNPGNSGGKPGRSGRKPDAFREKLEAVRDEHSLPVLAEILGGTITYPLNAMCEHCGKVSTGPKTFGDVLKLTPSTDSRLRAVDLSLRYTLGLEKTIHLDGIPDTRRAYDTIKATIRQRLAPDVAAALIDGIQEDLKHL